VLVEGAANLVLVDLARYLRKARGEWTKDRSKRAGLASWQLRRIYERVETSLELGCPSLEELAAHCGIGQCHMMRGFKVSTGGTVHKHIEKVRLAAAKRMLIDGNCSTKDVASRLGFSSAAYFSAAFRRLMAMTPTEFRSRARNAR
jgi:AraC family transcriptional regulator